ncbi:hypothetical protein HZS_6260 [Henneguya salminicola]|nr:hypothetical protein HZS_6260 [Henneguya salminicola]
MSSKFSDTTLSHKIKNEKEETKLLPSNKTNQQINIEDKHPSGRVKRRCVAERVEGTYQIAHENDEENIYQHFIPIKKETFFGRNRRRGRPPLKHECNVYSFNTHLVNTTTNFISDGLFACTILDLHKAYIPKDGELTPECIHMAIQAMYKFIMTTQNYIPCYPPISQTNFRHPTSQNSTLGWSSFQHPPSHIQQQPNIYPSILSNNPDQSNIFQYQSRYLTPYNNPNMMAPMRMQQVQPEMLFNSHITRPHEIMAPHSTVIRQPPSLQNINPNERY